MIRISDDEFNRMREGLAGAHLLLQAILPVLKQRRVSLDKDQRELVAIAPRHVTDAFQIIAAISQRIPQSPNAPAQLFTVKTSDIDTLLMRNEIENVAGLAMPDLIFEIQRALADLPGLQEIIAINGGDHPALALAGAVLWESGRRYGVLQGLEIAESTIDEFKTGIVAVLGEALNSTLELPAPQPFPPAAIGETGDAVPADERAAADSDPHKPHLVQ